MEIKDLKLLVKTIIETDITEFEMETEGEKIKIKRGCLAPAVQFQAPPVYAVQASAPAAPAPAVAAVAAAPAAEEPAGKAITSPIVGTFYRAPAPDAAPYVEVGQVVEKGQVLCIVEAMKLMNEIESEFRGKVVKIIKENAQPVEYGDPLFIIEPL